MGSNNLQKRKTIHYSAIVVGGGGGVAGVCVCTVSTLHFENYVNAQPSRLLCLRALPCGYYMLTYFIDRRVVLCSIALNNDFPPCYHKGRRGGEGNCKCRSGDVKYFIAGRRRLNEGERRVCCCPHRSSPGCSTVNPDL